jgi:hypothetical protein
LNGWNKRIEGVSTMPTLLEAMQEQNRLAERKKMMQTWADYLDGLKTGAKIIPFERVNRERHRQNRESPSEMKFERLE